MRAPSTPRRSETPPSWSRRALSAGVVVACVAVGAWVLSSLAPRQVDASKPVRVLKHSSAVFSVAWSPTGDQLAAGGIVDHRVSVWDPRSGILLRVLGDQGGVVTGLAYSPDGRLLAAGRGTVRLVKGHVSLTVWDARTGALVAAVPSVGPGSDGLHDVDRLAFSPDGKSLAAAAGGSIRIHEVSNWSWTRTVRTGGLVRSLCFSVAGRQFAAGDNVGAIRIWETDGWTVVRTIVAHASAAKALTFSRDGRFLASGTSIGATTGRLDERTGVMVRRTIAEPVRVWDVGTGQLIRELSGHSSEIEALESSPDGRLVVSGSRDRTVRFWDLGLGRTVATLVAADRVFATAFSPDGRWLAAGAGDTVTIWAANP